MIQRLDLAITLKVAIRKCVQIIKAKHHLNELPEKLTEEINL
jgi:hypothetical protein